MCVTERERERDREREGAGEQKTDTGHVCVTVGGLDVRHFNQCGGPLQALYLPGNRATAFYLVAHSNRYGGQKTVVKGRYSLPNVYNNRSNGSEDNNQKPTSMTEPPVFSMYISHRDIHVLSFSVQKEEMIKLVMMCYVPAAIINLNL